MKLTQMQDIGGCRSVLRHVGQVEALTKHYQDAAKKGGRRETRPQIHKIFDYIATPKETGYRGIHIIFKYQTDADDLKYYNDLKIEIQIRSRLQHYWAMAVETVDFFTGQALKSNLGDLPWKRFFILVANELARMESRPLIPGAPIDEERSKAELRSHSNQITALEGFHRAGQLVTAPPVTGKDGAQYFLLQLDLDKRVVSPTAFRRDQLELAQKRYADLEAQTKDKPTLQTVLVSVDSVQTLQKAYPSFYLDISEFLGVLRRILKT